MIDEITSIRIHTGVRHTNLANSTFGAPISSGGIATATAGGPLPAGQIAHHHLPLTFLPSPPTCRHNTTMRRLLPTTTSRHPLFTTSSHPYLPQLHPNINLGQFVQLQSYPNPLPSATAADRHRLHASTCQPIWHVFMAVPPLHLCMDPRGPSPPFYPCLTITVAQVWVPACFHKRHCHKDVPLPNHHLFSMDPPVPSPPFHPCLTITVDQVWVPACPASTSSTSQHMMAWSILLVGSIGASSFFVDNAQTRQTRFGLGPTVSPMTLNSGTYELDFGMPTWEQFKEACHVQFGPSLCANPIGQVGVSVVHFLGRRLHQQVSSAHVPQ
ncbi:hypothetical protein D1007_16585 [Hordeum vulgare]|nr:hypothetical protein D1007_16585 [Hordeum vulgare]